MALMWVAVLVVALVGWSEASSQVRTQCRETGQVWNECHSTCRTRCYQPTPTVCISMCYAGCACPDPLMETPDGSCVSRCPIQAAEHAVMVVPRALWTSRAHHAAITWASPTLTPIAARVVLQSVAAGTPVYGGWVHVTLGSTSTRAVVPQVDVAGEYHALTQFADSLNGAIIANTTTTTTTTTSSSTSSDSSDSSTSSPPAPASVTVYASSSSCFIETDKNIYKPGDTIRMRVVSIDASLLPLPHPITITIADPSLSKIARFLDLTPQSTTSTSTSSSSSSSSSNSTYGVVEATLPLAREPVLGTYTITATTRDTTASKTVQVDEYVLPRYSASVTTLSPTSTSVVATDTTSIRVRVNATYVFGKPVQGAHVALTVSQHRPTPVWPTPVPWALSPTTPTTTSPTTTTVATAEGTTGEHGSVELDIPLAHCNNILTTRCVLHSWRLSGTVDSTAVLTDTRTGEHASATSSSITVQDSDPDDVNDSNPSLSISADRVFLPNTAFVNIVSAAGVAVIKGDVTAEYQVEYFLTTPSTTSSTCRHSSWSTQYWNGCVAHDSTNDRDGPSGEADSTTWCPFVLQSDPEGYSQRQFEIAVMDPDEQQTEYANCVVDSIKVTVRPQGSSDWSERATHTLYRASVHRRDSALSISPVMAPVAASVMTFIITSSWGAVGTDTHWHYSVMARGDVMVSGSTAASTASSSTTISIPVSASQQTLMHDGATLICHVHRPADGLPAAGIPNYEVVVATLAITAAEVANMTGADDALSLSNYQLGAGFEISPVLGTTQPGDEVAVSVGIQGGEEQDVAAVNDPTRVWLLGVDTSVHLLAGDSALTTSQVQDAVSVYTSAGPDLAGSCSRLGTSSVLEQAGAGVSVGTGVVIADCGDSVHEWMWRIPIMAEAAGAMPTMAEAAAAVAPDGESDAADDTVRSYFPEAWIWEHVDVPTTGPGGGSLKLNTTAPDTITTWALSSFSVSPTMGLAVRTATGGGGTIRDELLVFKNFFVEPSLPYAATRGEALPVVVTVHNYENQDHTVDVSITSTGLEIVGSGALASTIEVPAGTVGSVKFTVRPTEVGEVKLSVQGRATSAWLVDTVSRVLRVDPEGIENELVYNHVFDFTGSQCSTSAPCTDSHVFPVALPSVALVPSSVRTVLTVTGDAMSQTLENLERLIKLPFGCGEQNLINMAPTTFAARYLTAVARMDPEWAANAENFIRIGYQAEQTYMHVETDPYSYSAFGDSDGRGSVWLTAMVMKTYAHASQFIYIDPDIQTKSAQWMMGTALQDGSFTETGRVIHSEMMGGVSGSGQVSLTAFVVIAVLEAAESRPDVDMGVEGLQASIEFLVSAAVPSSDLYTRVLVVYALALAGHSGADAALSAVMSDCSGTPCTYWSSSTQRANKAQKRDMPPCRDYHECAPPAADVETTAYVLLSLLRAGGAAHRVQAQVTANWMLSQRNSLGGFSSTQDTVLALQALSEHAASLSKNTDLSLVFTGLSGGSTVEPDTWSPVLTETNYDLLQTSVVGESAVGERGTGVSVTATGSGLAIVQMSLKYNVYEKLPEPPYEVECDWDLERGLVNVTARCKLGWDTGASAVDPCDQMAIIQCGIFTGFAAIKSSLDAIKTDPGTAVRRVEVSEMDRQVSFYLDGIKRAASATSAAQKELKEQADDGTSDRNTTFTWSVMQEYDVAGLSDVPNAAYAYYQPHLKGDSMTKAASTNDVCAQGGVDFPLHVLHAAGVDVRAMSEGTTVCVGSSAE